MLLPAVALFDDEGTKVKFDFVPSNHTAMLQQDAVLRVRKAASW